MHTIYGKRILMIKPKDIQIPSTKIRKRINKTQLELFAASIAANGIIEPLIVRKNIDGKYKLVSGYLRLRAARMVGIRRIPCIVHNIDDVTSEIYLLLENMQRMGYCFFEESKVIERLVSVYNMSYYEVAFRLGITTETLKNKLNILKLDEQIKEKIYSAGLTEKHAHSLLELPHDKIRDALEHIIVENLSAEQSRLYIETLINPKPIKETEKPTKEIEKPFRKIAIGDVRLFSNSLSKLVSTLNNSGINARYNKYENDRYVEFRVRIKKELPQNSAEQLKIC